MADRRALPAVCVIVLASVAACDDSGTLVPVDGGCSAADASTAGVRIVTHAPVCYAHYTSIQDAVNAAAQGDWILVDVGTYQEAVTITTPNVHLRGMDRNMVVLDGQHQVGDGIVVKKANGVSVENLTVHDFDRASTDGDHGNQIWWNGGDGSGMIGLWGWSGSYLTTYQTDLIGGYGLFVSNSVNGTLDQVYASGFNDAGLYIGACRDCQATVSHALIENNALGYSGTNSGGHLVIRDSVFQKNGNGICPNSLNNDDQPAPQDGSCDSMNNTSATPTFASTQIDRCTQFIHNTVTNNANFTTPADSTTASVPWGNGFVLVGTYGDLVDSNTITDNPSAGILGLENPDPFPPTSQTVYFQLAGNKITNNTFSGNGTNPDPSAADVILAGGGFGQKMSTNNCVSGNTLTKTTPPDLQTGWSCSMTTTPNPGITSLGYILALQTASQARKQMPQPPPPPQPTMPNPCDGVPANPLCAAADGGH